MHIFTDKRRRLAGRIRYYTFLQQWNIYTIISTLNFNLSIILKFWTNRNLLTQSYSSNKNKYNEKKCGQAGRKFSASRNNNNYQLYILFVRTSRRLKTYEKSLGKTILDLEVIRNIGCFFTSYSTETLGLHLGSKYRIEAQKFYAYRCLTCRRNIHEWSFLTRSPRMSCDRLLVRQHFSKRVYGSKYR